MDNKIIAIIAAVVIVAAGAAAGFFLLKKDDGEDGLSIVGRVNSEGSGIILKEGQNPDDYITIQFTEPAADAKYIKNGDTYYVFNVATWGGKVFATPGAATIQHVQLGELAAMMGLKYVSYTDGVTPANDTLYFMAGVPSFAEFSTKPANVVGYIIWEAQVSVGVVSGYPLLALTNDLFAGHTCCIIGASNDFIANDSETLEAFLNVYNKAVKIINDAKDDKFSDEYKELVRIAMNRVAMPDGLSDAQKNEAIKGALHTVTYLSADDATGKLDKLTTDIATLAEALYTSKQITNSATDLGFKDYNDLAQKFVNDKPMTNAISKDVAKFSSKRTIDVAVIAGDIHQIAIWYAIDTGMFDAINLEIKVAPQSNGPAIYTVLENGEVDVGFLGAPPMTIRCMNGEDIHA